jgi:hypothetical protein
VDENAVGSCSRQQQRNRISQWHVEDGKLATFLAERAECRANEFLNRRVTISAEDLVRLGFGGLQERLDVSERVMNFIRAGFEKLNKDWLRLRGELSKQE